MTEEQKNVIRCAYADLVGALQARNQLDIEVHDWKSHLLTIEELEEAFDFIEPVEIQE
jgi:hypothetical protein